MAERSQLSEMPSPQGQSSPQANSTLDAALNEDTALALLADRDLSAAAIGQINQNGGLMKSRKIRITLASHPHTPRRIALRLIRELYSIELMHFAISVTAPADLKRIADELLIARVAAVTLGERVSLARRCSEKVAGTLLLDKESRVWQAGLENPRLTEATVVRALQKTGASAAFVEAVTRHAKWSVRSEVRIALLRNAHTPLPKALECARHLSPSLLRDILHASRLPEKIKAHLRKECLKDK